MPDVLGRCIFVQLREGLSVRGVGRDHIPLSKQRQTRRFSQRHGRLVIELASVLGFVSPFIGVFADGTHHFAGVTFSSKGRPKLKKSNHLDQTKTV